MASLCPTGKIRHLTRADAKDTIKRMRAKGDQGTNGLHPFLCPLCGLFHLGHDNGVGRSAHVNQMKKRQGL